MLTIAGNGMGEYDFSNIKIDIDEFDTIVCDKNFKESGDNILKGSYREIKEYISQNYSRENILYIVTGSPYFYSAGVLIAKTVPEDMVKIINNTSSKEYMQERLMVGDGELGVVSIHGREFIDLEIFLKMRYTLILCDRYSIEKISKALRYISPVDIVATIGYRLGYADERVEEIDIYDFDKRSFDLAQPYVIMIERLFVPRDPLSSDDDFSTQRGMITKRYKRDLSLQNLDLKPNQLLWDVGAGSGSCGIEAYKRYRVRTTFFEKQTLRVSYIEENLASHFVCGARLVEGEAEKLFDSIDEKPQRIFVGGGGSKVISRLPYLYERLDDEGVMLINAITLKHLSQMINILNSEDIEYSVISLSLTTYKGRLDMVEPERQLFQIKIKKQ